MKAPILFDLSRLVTELPCSSGLFAFQDAGRIWLACGTLPKWHVSRGGGPWIGLPGRSHPLTLTFARSEWRTAWTLRTGFSF